MRKNFLLTTFCLAGIFLLNGCSNAVPETYTDANFSELQTDVATTICSVSGQRVIKEENVKQFNSLASRLDNYEGTRKDQIVKLSGMLRSTSESWSYTLGSDLGKENADKLTSLCEKVKI